MLVSSLAYSQRLRWFDVATKLTHPKEWEQFLIMCDRRKFDNPLFEHYRNMFFVGSKTKDNPAEFIGRLKPVKVTKPDGTSEVYLGRNELAEKLEIYPNYITQQNGKIIKKGKLKGWRFDVLPKPTPIYALYDEDELLGIGTPDELSRKHGIAISTLEFYLYQQARPGTNRRVLLVDWEFPELEDEE